MMRINLVLDGQVEKKFKKLKDWTGIKGSTDLLRHLITIIYDKELERKSILKPDKDLMVNHSKKI